MKQLNWYQIFGQTHTIPDGSTVTPTDDVQILLNCANIWDKAYTTIADLLSDTTSLLAVIVDNNAINYLVRSTTFASSMTADATAMTDIGGDNYASNTLLGDSTWCTAICNSTYFESVLNVKVPPMTSNTTPSGVCSAYPNPREGSYAWNAFDGNDSTNCYWVILDSSSPYVQYVFPTEFTAYKWEVINSSRTPTFSILTSADGILFNAIATKTSAPAGKISKIISSPTTTKAVRWQAPSQTYPFVLEVQIYGRRDI